MLYHFCIRRKSMLRLVMPPPRLPMIALLVRHGCILTQFVRGQLIEELVILRHCAHVPTRQAQRPTTCQCIQTQRRQKKKPLAARLSIIRYKPKLTDAAGSLLAFAEN